MREFIKHQYENLFFWAPLLMAFGGALFFAMPYNIVLSAPIAIILATVSMAIAIFAPRVVRALMLFIFGFCYAAAFTALINTPQIQRNLFNANITATVETIDYTPDRARIYLKTDSAAISARPAKSTTVRVTTDLDSALPSPGDRINATVSLYHASPAYVPDGFDFARWAYFNGITATGALSDWTLQKSADHITASPIRNHIHNAAESFLTDALVLGYKNALSKSDREIWTTAGIAHVWSISGFHMTLVSGWLFVMFYFILRRIPYITRRIPARTVAMSGAWFGLMLYILIAGGGAATMRAFLMATLVFGAFILGRGAISLRNICLAFCIIFLINPYYVMTAGFQLSFAAVFGLVWFWGGDRKMPHNKISKVLYAAIMTSLVATLFTAPFVAAHFNSFQAYGILGNVLLLPIFSFLIMPLVMIGTVTALLGIGAPLIWAAHIYDFALRGATMIANLPMASITTPNISNLALTLIILGFASLIFVRPYRYHENKILCAIFITCAIIVIGLRPRPMFFATYDHELVAFAENGELTFNKSRASNHFFAFDTWKQMIGAQPNTTNIRRKCNGGVCMYQTDKFKLAYIQKFVPLMKNIENLCNDDNIDYIVSYFDIRAPRCHAKILRDGLIIYETGRIENIPRLRPWHKGPR